jgi:3D (Asp-Asp-Asp) domain-containing protein
VALAAAARRPIFMFVLKATTLLIGLIVLMPSGIKTKTPVKKVVARATVLTTPIKIPRPVPKPPIVVTPARYICVKKIKAVITAYSPNDPRQGTGWKTASGRHAKHPGVAVDPRVIPLGSVVEINGSKYLADDTGGGVRGRHIDLRVASRGSALRWGRKHMIVKVYRKVKNG